MASPDELQGEHFPTIYDAENVALQERESEAVGPTARDMTRDLKVTVVGDRIADEDVQISQYLSGPLGELQRINSKDINHPIHWSSWRKWLIVSVYCWLQTFVLLTSTSYVSIEYTVQTHFNVGSTQVVCLGQSMFIIGTAVGPVFLGPLSDFAGRKWVYVIAILLYAILNIGTALAYNMPMLIIFCFLIGVAGSVALCNIAGTIADLFGDTNGAGQPMALFVLSANLGPALGGVIGQWIDDNPHMGWRWVFYINIIIGGAFALGLCVVPETLPSVVIIRARKARETQDLTAEEPISALPTYSFMQRTSFVIGMALRIMITEPIVLFLAVYNGFTYGLLFLYLDGVFDVFTVNNGLSYIDANLTFLNFGVGATLMFLFVPVQTYLYSRAKARHGACPEDRFLTSIVAVWLFPISLLWFGFTSDGSVSYWSPIIAGTVLGFADPLLWLSMLNYITDSYPHVAASAIAAFLIPSFLIAAAMCHAGIAMFENLSTKWAFATLGFVSCGVVALVYVLFFFGRWFRTKSRMAKS